MSKNATTRKRQKERKAERFARQFHSEDRVRFVQQLNCANCGRLPSENAHTVRRSQGGGYMDIAPLCGPDFDANREGCHAEYDRDPAAFEAKYTINMRGKALRTQGWWLDHLDGEEVLGF